MGILLHITNNFIPIKNYGRGKLIWIILLLVSSFFLGSYYQIPPFGNLMDYGARQKATTTNGLQPSGHEIVEMELNKELQLSIDLVRAEHYWHPQMAIWMENENGTYIKTLFVSKATAKGFFFGGRNKENFKEFDESKQTEGKYRRVNALPIWSHKRGVRYLDGALVPTRENPLPDAISGATLSDNFYLRTSTDYHQKFRIKVELNVAFDDNEYYSEFDFPNDEIFHNGTGQLGQPSILFESLIDMNDSKKYYLMKLMGHGHHSAQTGTIYEDVSKLTTALQLVERIVVGVSLKEVDE